ncbi:MAG: bifunctional demethylmenaquinone methyltransferase/2-methoxy-6-polyprenyl-1,4-benzoquinol methylase UbiE [Polyangiales bacterium]
MTQSNPTRLGSGSMFDAIAERYDVLNRVLSLGIDQGWRRDAVDALELETGDHVLDLATGTADLALQIAESASVSVVGSDPSPNMLSVGRAKVKKSRARVTLDEGDAQALPYGENEFDACSMAFGIRNVPDRELALREMVRVVRPGGRIVILELGEPDGTLIGPLARFHVHHVVPRIGALVSGQAEYRYLQESIAAFPSAPAFAALMQKSGVRDVEVRRLTFGAANLYVGRSR